MSLSAALACAREVMGTTAPNPSVGAVIMRDGRVIGRGATRPVGGLHAERHALANCTEDPRGSTLYVTLEPCGHHGRQPPCTDALVQAGIREVIIGVLDPNPMVAGGSLPVLRDAGIRVTVVNDSSCRDSVLGFARAITRGLPEVTLKAATSADGAIATSGGLSQWITGEEARLAGQHLRATHDAILVGIGTVLADDPRLTCRVPGSTSPTAVVLDRSLRLADDAHLNRPGVIVFCNPDAPVRSLQAEVVRTGTEIEPMLRMLVERGLHRVLVEGGAHITRSFLEAQLVDTLHQFIGPRLIPGGRTFVAGDVARLDAFPMSLTQARVLGDGAHLTWALEHRVPPEWACSQD